MDNAKVGITPSPHHQTFVSTKNKDSRFLVEDGYAFVKEKRAVEM